MVYHPAMVDKLLAQELAKPYPSVVRIVGVKIRDRGEIKKFDAGKPASPSAIASWSMLPVS